MSETTETLYASSSKLRSISKRALRYSGVALVGLLAAGAVVLNVKRGSDSTDSAGSSDDQ